MDLLTSLHSQKEMNLLILGQTGVGKSTWINAFQNYLIFSNLKEATRYNLKSLIPTQFTIYDADLNKIIISTGSDINENHVIGQSATQKSKVYSFVIGDTKIRLIDTPGIGDTRGIEQDKLNFEDILSTLSCISELHGICILLKSNETRLGPMFEFCIKELLTNLHKDACKNIVFCFTNTRSTDYSPGETITLLTNLLNSKQFVTIPICKNTAYCFDSESYRYLAAIKNQANPVNFLVKNFTFYAESWAYSVSETERMIQYLANLKPHPIANTLCLNAARDILQKLTRPMADISCNIQTNKENIKDTLNEIHNNENTINVLEKQKTCKKIELEITEIDYPKTVCTNISCKTVYTDGGLVQTKYNTVCHERCNIKGIKHNTIGDVKLLYCEAFNVSFVNKLKKNLNKVFNLHLLVNEVCKNCHHSYKEHMHIFYETKEVLKDVEDKKVVEVLQSAISVVKKKELLIKIKKNEISELDNELNILVQSSAMFESFLKQNAVTPYNDATLRYLEYLIHEENDKVNNGKSDKLLKSFQNYRDTYKQNKYILDNARVDSSFNISEIFSLIDSLYKLKYSGIHLQKSIYTEKRTHSFFAAYEEVAVQTNVN